MHIRESTIEQELIEKLGQLKYTLRPDIRDRAAMERNFREKFEALNRVKLTDAEFQRLFDDGRGHLVGTSGAITSLAGIHLNLPRYNRDRVDGLWMTRADCEAAADRLKALGPDGRAREACIGPDRADLVLAGAAILEAVQRAWPSERVRVADRGLREGLLLQRMREDKKPPRGRRHRRGRGRPAPAA